MVLLQWRFYLFADFNLALENTLEMDKDNLGIYFLMREIYQNVYVL